MVYNKISKKAKSRGELVKNKGFRDSKSKKNLDKTVSESYEKVIKSSYRF